MRATEAIDEGRRVLEICNACRYCESYCAVFPAMELRREFSNEDVGYLANLCHGCRGCYYSCQFAPPHEFAINLPRTFAQVRAETYEFYAWPRPLAALFRRNGMVVSLILAAAVAAVLALTMGLQSPNSVFGRHMGTGAFYAVIPYATMVTVATVTFVYALLALVMGGIKFWRDAGPTATESGATESGATEVTGFPALKQALIDVLTLRNLGGGGYGCNDRDESFSGARRVLHHTMFYGFLACFAATSVATIYHHVLGWIAPYPFFSIPVLLGTVGGIGLLVGTVGLFVVKVTGDPTPTARELFGADTALLVLLALAAFTGLLLLTLRGTDAMGVLLALHLGVVLALFLTLPYSKFVHGIYRFAALLRAAREMRHS